MSNKNYINDLNEIKKLMSRSSRFLSLTGSVGIWSGVYALIGSGIAYLLLENKSDYSLLHSTGNTELILKLVIIAFSVAYLAVVTSYIITRKKAIQNSENMWDQTTKYMLLHFLIPLVTGGFLILILLYRELYDLIVPVSLIFYGLALVNISKFTLDTVKYLGVIDIVLGLLAVICTGYDLFFWAFGFGILHIVYGGIMYFKRETKTNH